MKRLITGLAIMLILFAFTLSVSHIAGSNLSRLSADIDISINTEKREQAFTAASRAEERWRKMESFMHLFIRHSEVDAVSDAMIEYIASFSSPDEGQEGLWAKLSYHIKNIMYMEKLSFGTVF